MREVDFFQLPRPIQDRFVGAAQGGVPSPIMVSRPRQFAHLIWFGAAAISFAILLLVARAGFGALDSSLALQSPVWLPVYGALAGLSAFCLLRGSACTQRERLLPYRPWVYFFPVGIIDARNPKLRVFEATEIDSVEGVAGSSKVTVRAGGETFVFDVGDAKNVQVAQSAIDEAKRLLRHADETHNRRDRAVLDPISDTGFSNPFSPKTPLVRREALPLVKSVPVALLLGVVLGSGLWWLRNNGSADRLYANARQQNDLAAYRAYLQRGGSRSDVTEVLLPRAELEQARKAGSLEAIEEFIRTHPNSKIHAEVASAEREVLLKKLEEAAAVGTITALDEFSRAHKRHDLVRPELERARQAVYTRALHDFKAQASPRNAEVVPFFERLLRYAQAHGPRVEIRFQRKVAGSSASIEQAVQKHTYYMGTVSLPTQYFDEAHARVRERDSAEKIIERLQKAFPPDILKFEHGAPLGENEELPDPVKVPTLFVQHTVQMNGLYLSRNPRGVFVGLGALFNGTFVVPGASERLETKFSQWRPPDTSLLEKEGASVPQVYEASAVEAFDKFRRRLLATIFDKAGAE